jgi:hypothetical protein
MKSGETCCIGWLKPPLPFLICPNALVGAHVFSINACDKCLFFREENEVLRTVNHDDIFAVFFAHSRPRPLSKALMHQDNPQFRPARQFLCGAMKKHRFNFFVEFFNVPKCTGARSAKFHACAAPSAVSAGFSQCLQKWARGGADGAGKRRASGYFIVHPRVSANCDAVHGRSFV